MAEAFLGYVLPWGQMSFWGATVITKFFSVVPYFGGDLILWLWGGFSVKNPTLIRFFSFHFVIPFLILFLVLVHLLFLHDRSSSNPKKTSNSEKISFFPYFLKKDVLGFVVGFIFAYLLMFFFPFFILEEQNFILAKFLVTPTHIQPEWYFLSAYAVLRSIPKKLGGVIGLLLFVIVYLFLPFVYTQNTVSFFFKKLNQTVLVRFCLNFLFLTWVGAQPVEDPFIFLSQVSSFLYFLYFLFVYVMLSWEKLSL